MSPSYKNVHAVSKRRPVWWLGCPFAKAIILYSTLPISRGHFPPITHARAMYGCLSWVQILAEVLSSNSLYCAQYRVILYRDISRVCSTRNTWVLCATFYNRHVCGARVANGYELTSDISINPLSKKSLLIYDCNVLFCDYTKWLLIDNTRLIYLRCRWPTIRLRMPRRMRCASVWIRPVLRSHIWIECYKAAQIKYLQSRTEVQESLGGTTGMFQGSGVFYLCGETNSP